MIRMQEPELQPYEDHSAWQASWTDDEAMVAHTPSGYWMELIYIAYFKRFLQKELQPDVRLQILERLNEMVRGYLTLDALQRVDPACDVAVKMVEETNNLSIPDKCRMFSRWNIMAAFCNLNPSLVEAMRLMNASWTSRVAA